MKQQQQPRIMNGLTFCEQMHFPLVYLWVIFSFHLGENIHISSGLILSPFISAENEEFIPLLT